MLFVGVGKEDSFEKRHEFDRVVEIEIRATLNSVSNRFLLLMKFLDSFWIHSKMFYVLICFSSFWSVFAHVIKFGFLLTSTHFYYCIFVYDSQFIDWLNAKHFLFETFLSQFPISDLLFASVSRTLTCCSVLFFIDNIKIFHSCKQDILENFMTRSRFSRILQRFSKFLMPWIIFWILTKHLLEPWNTLITAILLYFPTTTSKQDNEWSSLKKYPLRQFVNHCQISDLKSLFNQARKYTLFPSICLFFVSNRVFDNPVRSCWHYRTNLKLLIKTVLERSAHFFCYCDFTHFYHVLKKNLV